MNINLIFEKRKCSFDIPINATIKYIKTLCSKIFKSPSLNICYKEINISNEKNETTKLKEIISKDETNITLIVSKKQPETVLKKNTFSTKTSENNDVKTESEISSENKLFDSTYSQKYKNVIFNLKDLNNKIIDVDNYLFRKTKISKEQFQETMNIFEKKVNEFFEGLIIYYKKIVDSLNNLNDCIKKDDNYDNFIQSLNQFYNEISFYDENNESNNEDDIVINSPKNKIISMTQKSKEEKMSRNTKNSFTAFTEQESLYSNKTPKLPLINPNNIVIPLFLQEKEKEDELKNTIKNNKIRRTIFNSEIRKRKKSIPLLNVTEEKNEDTTPSNNEDNNQNDNKNDNQNENENENENEYYTSRNGCVRNLKLETKNIDNIIHDIKTQNTNNGLYKKQEHYEDTLTIQNTKEDENKIKINDEEQNENKENNYENISKLVHDLTEVPNSPKKEKHCGFLLSTKNISRTDTKNDVWGKMKTLNIKSRKDLDMKDMMRRQSTRRKISKSLNKFDFLI